MTIIAASTFGQLGGHSCLSVVHLSIAEPVMMGQGTSLRFRRDVVMQPTDYS